MQTEWKLRQEIPTLCLIYTLHSADWWDDCESWTTNDKQRRSDPITLKYYPNISGRVEHHRNHSQDSQSVGCDSYYDLPNTKQECIKAQQTRSLIGIYQDFQGAKCLQAYSLYAYITLREHNKEK